MGETILKMQGIQKYFSGVHALKGVDFELKAGEVHALMGENGAGKSTLIKVLCGIHKRDGGSMEYFGDAVDIHNIAEINALEGGTISKCIQPTLFEFLGERDACERCATLKYVILNLCERG